MATGSWRVREESVSMERLDGETILINFDTGQYFSFQGPAADVLWLVQAGTDRSKWAGAVEAAYPGTSWDDDVAAQVDAFLSQLEQAGVIVVADDADGSAEAAGIVVSLPADCERAAWTAPAVAANDDLADLLVIDPIHDASEDGWPQARSAD